MRELLEKCRRLVLNSNSTNEFTKDDRSELIKEIEAELSRPVEPVVWMYKDSTGVVFENSGDPDHGWIPIFAHPPAKPECTNSDAWNCKYCNKTNNCEAFYIAEMSRKDALEEAAKISDQYVSCELIGDKIRALKDKQ